MASLRRSKTMPADGATARFLYTILKQLDLKAIDWNLVASQLEITNGHAARMRFSRFKQHMEGIPTNPRTPRPKKPKQEKSESKKRGLEETKDASDDASFKSEPKIKKEADKEEGRDMPSSDMPSRGMPSVEESYSHKTVTPMELSMETPRFDGGLEDTVSGGLFEQPVPKIKVEDGNSDEIQVKLEPVHDD